MSARPRSLELAFLLLARILLLVGTLAGVAALMLALLAAAPGDPIDLIPGGEAWRGQLEAEWGLDRPLVHRWIAYLSRAGHGDLGLSVAYRPGAPVADLVAGPALRSLGWLLCALALSVGGAIGLAVVPLRGPLRALLAAVSVAPVFLLAHAAVHGLNALTFRWVEAGWIDRPAWFALPHEPSSLRTALAVVVLAVGSGALSGLHTEIQSAFQEIRSSAFVEAARARGEPVWPILLRHLVPQLSVMVADRAAFFAGGLVVLERVFLLNGAGHLLWRAAELRDYDLALGLGLISALWVGGARLGSDLVRLAADPRTRALGRP